MKLRNKKTGGLANMLGEQDFIRVYTDAGWADYVSLAELNEEWEDYKPKEPLIKDEKIRKAVRAWAEANSIKDMVCFMTKDGFKFAGNPISLETHFNQPLEIDTDGIYTIAELCGGKE